MREEWNLQTLKSNQEIEKVRKQIESEAKKFEISKERSRLEEEM
jgi:hypothetical protein